MTGILVNLFFKIFFFTKKRFTTRVPTEWSETHKYLSGKLNYKISADCTMLSEANGWVLFIVDLASRTVIGHYQMRAKHSSDSVYELLLLVINESKFILTEIRILLVDNGTEFANGKVKDLCDEHKIKIIFTDAGKLQNQVSESVNNSIKNRMRVALNPSWRIKEDGKKQMLDPLRSFFSDKKIGLLVKKAVEAYNESPSTLYPAISKNFVQESLIGAQPCGDMVLVSKNDKSANALAIKNHVFGEIVKTVDNSYSSLTNFEKVSLQLQHATNQETKRISDKLEVLQESLDLKEKELIMRETEFQNQLFSMETEHKTKLDVAIQNFNEVQAHIKEQHDAAAAKTAAKLRYKNRKKMPIRETLSVEEFEACVKLVPKPLSYKGSRTVLTLFFLFLTGLRISQLLQITVAQFNRLIETGTVTISLIKNGDPRFVIIFTTKQRNVLKKISENYTLLLDNKVGEDFVFTSHNDFKKGLNRSNFNTETNKVLKDLSKKVGKNLLSHSFRATAITELLECQNELDIVSKVIGHKNILTTALYDRRKLTRDKIREINNSRVYTTRKTKLLDSLDIKPDDEK